MYARIAASPNNPEALDFRDSTKAILFFGTPHFGSDWSAAHAAVLKLSSYFTPATEHIAKLLAKNSPYLEKLQSDFALFSSDLRIRYFFEELTMGMGLRSILASDSF